MTQPRTLSPAATSPAAILARIAEEHGYSIDALRGRSQEERLCRARARAMKALRERGWSIRRIGAYFGNRTPGAIHYILCHVKERQQSVQSYLEHPDLIHEVEAQLRRITGVNLTHQVAYQLSIPTWQAIFLSILMEAYPNVRTAEQIMEAYEAASERLNQESNGAMDSQIRTFNYHIRKRFEALGLPEPVDAIRPRGFVLTYAAAVWLHNQFGRPLMLTQSARASA
jgi:hypothetical protein